MSYKEFSQKDWRAFANLNDTVAELDQKCDFVLARLSEAFLVKSILGSGACRIELTHNSTSLATIVTPVSEGRILRSYSRFGGELQGLLILQRKIVDEFDRDRWVPVWTLTVPRHDPPHIGTRDSGQRFELDSFTRNRSSEAFSMAMTVLDAMVDHHY